MERMQDADVRAAIEGTGWELEGHELVRRYEFGDFADAMVFVNRVAELAEERNHHPDIAISWNKVTLRQSTHTVGGVTRADLQLVRAIDGLGG